MEYTWTISVLNSRIKETVEGQELNNIVNVVHWRYRATDGEYTTETYGSLGLNEPDPNDFILYENLTEADVITWLDEGMDVPEMQASLAKSIELLKNPIEETLPLPWDES